MTHDNSIYIEWEDPRITECQTWFNENLPGSLSMSHYDLYAMSGMYTAQLWKEFLMHPQVADFIRSEEQILIRSQRAKLAQDAEKNVRSPGLGQNLTALTKLLEGDANKTGPIFIYSYIPLNEKEMRAPNARQLPIDPFLKRKK